MTTRVGIVGGGQLGYFLCLAARPLGVETIVLSPTADCPAARAADDVLVGGYDDPTAAAALADASDTVTFEIEAVGTAALEYLRTRARRGDLHVAPSPDIMLRLQNKALQKEWLVRNGLPTPAFVDLAAGPGNLQALVDRFGLPLVQKTAVGGYDGRGVQIIHDASSLGQLWRAPSIVEAFVHDALEISVLAARGPDGNVAAYEPALLRVDPDSHALGTVLSPAPLAPASAEEARRLAIDVVTKLGGVGLFAIEMFVAGGRVQINEISPRVHNSGHLTVEASDTSQFTQHLRAILGLPLGSCAQRRPAVMKNLLYCDRLAPLCTLEGFDAVNGRRATAVHWYGKRQGRRFRKMGHVTALGSSLAEAERRADAAARALRLASRRHGT